jgi:hypothetical protein
MDNATLLDVRTLQRVEMPGLKEVIAKLETERLRIEAFSTELNYIIAGNPAAERTDSVWKIVDIWNGAIIEFRCVGKYGDLVSVDEKSNSGQTEKTREVWGLYRDFEPDKKQIRYTFVDAADVVVRSRAIPHPLTESLRGSQQAYWNPEMHLVLFFEAGVGSADGSPIRVMIWDYQSDKVTYQTLDVSALFRIVGGHYLPRA